MQHEEASLYPRTTGRFPNWRALFWATPCSLPVPCPIFFYEMFYKRFSVISSKYKPTSISQNELHSLTFETIQRKMVFKELDIKVSTDNLFSFRTDKTWNRSFLRYNLHYHFSKSFQFHQFYVPYSSNKLYLFSAYLLPSALLFASSPFDHLRLLLAHFQF